MQPDPRHYLSQGWLYGFSDGRGGYPLEWTALKAWGVDRPEPERFPGSGGKGYEWPAHGWHEFRDPNEEWEMTFYRNISNVVRQINQNVEDRAGDQGLRAVEPELGDLRRAQTSGAWMHVEHGLGLYLFANAQRRAPTNMHNNAISVTAAPDPLRAGPGALQPHAQRGARGLRRPPNMWRPGTVTRPGRASAGSPNSSRRSMTGRRRSLFAANMSSSP